MHFHMMVGIVLNAIANSNGRNRSVDTLLFVDELIT